MRGVAFLAAAVALVAGCETRPSPDAPAPPAASATPSASIARVATLAGEWRVAGIDGRPFDEPYGLALTADTRAIWWEPRCAGAVRGYRIEGDRIDLGPDPDLPPRKPGEPTRAICTIGPPPRLADVMRALDASDSVRRTPSNGVELSGDGRSLLLFSQ